MAGQSLAMDGDAHLSELVCDPGAHAVAEQRERLLPATQKQMYRTFAQKNQPCNTTVAVQESTYPSAAGNCRLTGC